MVCVGHISNQNDPTKTISNINSLFVVGENKTLTSNTEGYLYLGIYDGAWSDNDGNYCATVLVSTPTPTPTNTPTPTPTPIFDPPEMGLIKGVVYEIPENTSNILTESELSLLSPALEISKKQINIPAMNWSGVFPGQVDSIDYFQIEFTGYINVDNSGDHTFKLLSKDGSKLWINNSLIINNDGIHSPSLQEAIVYLTTGIYPFKISFFKGSLSQIALILSWVLPGQTEEGVVPENAFVDEPPCVLPYVQCDESPPPESPGAWTSETDPQTGVICVKCDNPSDGNPCAGCPACDCDYPESDPTFGLICKQYCCEEDSSRLYCSPEPEPPTPEPTPTPTPPGFTFGPTPTPTPEPTPIPENIAPLTVEDLTCDSVTTTSITISWSAPKDGAFERPGPGICDGQRATISEYVISGGPSGIVFTTSTSYSFNGLSPNTSYTFNVRAKNNCSKSSENAAVITCKTLECSFSFDCGSGECYSCDNGECKSTGGICCGGSKCPEGSTGCCPGCNVGNPDGLGPDYEHCCGYTLPNGLTTACEDGCCTAQSTSVMGQFFSENEFLLP